MWLVLSLMAWGAVAVLGLVYLPQLWRYGQTLKQYFLQRSEQDLAARFVFIQGHALAPLFWVSLVVGAGLFGWATGSWWWMLIGAMLSVMVWPLALRWWKKRRLQHYEKQLPDYLLALAGALRAGSSLAVAMQRMTPLCHAPLVQELSLVLREQRMGVARDEAFARLYARMPCEGNSLLRSALAVAGQSGGGLADLLESMAHTINQRLYIEGRIRALTAQGRIQAWVMVALPFLVGAALYVLDSALIAPLWQEASGRWVLLTIIVLEALGLWFIYRIVNIRL